jgi:uncharacterized protein (UPF0335 family)
METRRSLPQSLPRATNSARADIASPTTSLPLPDGTTDATRAPAREGDNRVDPTSRDLLRSAVQRIRAQRAIIDDANTAISDTYRTLRAAGLNPGIVKKVVNRLGMTREERVELEERDELLRLYWQAVEDLTAEIAGRLVDAAADSEA